ncbi:MAG: hypothetical protein ABS73_12425 [Paracoccus sp. SCN 68-21]|nr:MAG: hypothetical protein ABS73_12425 [Paracoccus sp. SCN 68-21]
MVIAFLRSFPDMRVDLVTEGRLVDIVAEGFDLGLRPTDLVPRDMIALPLGPPQRFAMVASPNWIAAHGTSPDACRTAPRYAGPSSRPERCCRSRPRAVCPSMWPPTLAPPFWTARGSSPSSIRT